MLINGIQFKRWVHLTKRWDNEYKNHLFLSLGECFIVKYWPELRNNWPLYWTSPQRCTHWLSTSLRWAYWACVLIVFWSFNQLEKYNCRQDGGNTGYQVYLKGAEKMTEYYEQAVKFAEEHIAPCLLYTSPSPRD